MNNILSTIHSKYQGETMFCFVCVATVFGYILGVNKVVDAILSKHSHDKHVKVVRMINKYTQTNLSDLAELLASKNIIFTSSDKNETHDVVLNDDNNDHNNDHNNEKSQNLKCQHSPPSDQEKQDNQENHQQQHSVMSPSSISSSIYTSEEDYELVKKNENNSQSKNKKSANYFEWLNIF